MLALRAALVEARTFKIGNPADFVSSANLLCAKHQNKGDAVSKVENVYLLLGSAIFHFKTFRQFYYENTERLLQWQG